MELFQSLFRILVYLFDLIFFKKNHLFQFIEIFILIINRIYILKGVFLKA